MSALPPKADIDANRFSAKSPNPFSPAAAIGVHLRSIACSADAVDWHGCEPFARLVGKREHQRFGEVVSTN
jgi:hypothetical protein